MKKMFFIGCLLCLAAVCRAQYIGSDYLNMKFDYVVDESQMQGTVGYGKVFKCFKVGANLNYRNLNREQVQANTVTVGYQRAKTKSELVYLERSRAFVYGYEVGVRPELLLSPKVALFAEYRFEMLFNSILRNNNHIGLGCVIYL